MLVIVFLFFGCAAMAQNKPTRIILQHYETFNGDQPDDLTKVYKGTFLQDYSTLTSDSAYFHPKKNTFEAFGHVVITQGDTLHIYGDKLDYDGNTKIAIMTDHVKLVDKDATLTTNHFVYNTGTRIGTYTDGGRLVNQGDTLVSKNGFYFAQSRDAYFRYKVVMNTADAIIKTDTLRYNAGTAISYFYGPTHIYGKKDKDVLYTENGTYNTKTEQAFFGKNNLYTQGTKSLKGDSLFYDRLAGYGKALKHITFNDEEQKISIKGDKGEYTKADERTVVTENAYAIIATVDSTKRDTSKKDTIVNTPKKATLADSVNKPVAHTMKYVEPKSTAAAAKQIDTLTKVVSKKDSVKSVKRDSIFLAADTIETQIQTHKVELTTRRLRLLAGLRDTTIKIIPKKKSKELNPFTALQPRLYIDSTAFLHRDYFPKPPADTSQHKALVAKKKPVRKPVITRTIVAQVDSVNLVHPVTLSDTARVRILSAYHKAKIFKSDLQARADSIFYSYSDSTVRMYVKPMVWSNGSQLSGDTINMQMRNKKVDNVELYPHAFAVNIEKGDSLHFNQVAGRKMRGYFKDGKIEKIFVNGNAETVYYNRDSLKHAIEIVRTISSRIRVTFAKGELTSILWTVKPDERDIPLGGAKEEDKVLKGFIWKPNDRPVSKESIIPSSYLIPPVSEKSSTKTTGKKKGNIKQPANTTAPKPTDIKSKTDSAKTKPDTLKKPMVKPDIAKSN